MEKFLLVVVYVVYFMRTNIQLIYKFAFQAGASQVIFTNPLEIVKIRLQVAGEIASM